MIRNCGGKLKEGMELLRINREIWRVMGFVDGFVSSEKRVVAWNTWRGIE